MSHQEYTGGSVSYYTVRVERPTNADAAPYSAECNDIIEALGMNYAEGNAFKALWRRCAARNLGLAKHGYKDGRYDAEKVVFFGQRLIAQEPDARPAADSDRPNEQRRQDAEAEDEAFAAIEASQPRIDSGPMWVEWRGESEEPPVHPEQIVGVRFRGGVERVSEAGHFRWEHRVGFDADLDIVAWRTPWPDDCRIDAIGQNGGTGEHCQHMEK